jgi:hypothetical protein
MAQQQNNRIDIEPKPLQPIPVKTVEEKVKEAMTNLESNKSSPETVNWNWDDTGNLMKKLIGNLTVQVYNGKITLMGWVTMLVVALFLVFKLTNIF